MTITIPGYKLERTLGKGGMATVYLAKQALLGRTVALKVMHPNAASDPNFNKRFMREARIVSQLVHPNIVTVHEVGEHDGHYFLSMEYIDGKDLSSVRGKLSLKRKIRMIADIAKALNYAGAKGYVHRDIKPENIMFRSVDGSAVLTDFGIAKAQKSDLAMTQAGTAIGTPHYMSPEQAKGADVDGRSDLYSLGVVFYLMLTGQVPYDGESAVEIGIKHITAALPELPYELRELQPILDGLLAKKPEQRFQTGQALLDELARLDVKRIVQQQKLSASQPTVLTEVPTAVAEASVADESATEQGHASDSQRFTIEFENTEIAEAQPGSFLPVFFASSFVLFSLCFFIYMARPAALEPLIERSEQRVAEVYQSLKGRLGAEGQNNPD
ncbi:serine/threonine-protein kinase [Agaribacterium haliotis]|uniref:serine/threonine-protein kinase n=1 Tax=Agaribacterium haliotis TaxID=2013869 RepID=UPI000BB54EC6|nr:serine/threonine-protein kinase [Agaribacterium haliotis]